MYLPSANFDWSINRVRVLTSSSLQDVSFFFYFDLWVTAARQTAAPPTPLGCTRTYSAASEDRLAGHPSYAVPNLRVVREQWIGCSMKDSGSKLDVDGIEVLAYGVSRKSRETSRIVCVPAQIRIGVLQDGPTSQKPYSWVWLTYVHLHVVKAYWVVEVKLHSFLTSALDGDVWSASRLGCFASG